MNEDKKEPGKRSGVRRRDVLKALGSLPVFGGFIYSFFKKKSLDKQRREKILDDLGLEKKAPEVLPKSTFKDGGELIRVGIIGFGGRGEHLARALGFAHPDFFELRG